MDNVAALYYPHTTIHSLGLLKTALLLWDYVECVVPSDHPVVAESEAQDLREAEELIIRQRIPTMAEKQAVHARVERLVKDGVPDWVHAKFDNPDERFYRVYPGKLLDKTWQLLEHMEVARLVGSGARDYQVPPPLGLLLMSMLADECAGATRVKLTDRIQAYSWLMGALTSDLGGEYVGDVPDQSTSNYDRLATVAIRTVQADEIPLHRLVELRRREAGGSSNDFRNLRQAYAVATSAFIRRLADPALSETDRSEIQRQYEAEMERDLRELKRDLGLAKTKALLSKEVGAAVLALAGTTIHPLSALVGVGPLVKMGVEYSEARRKALESHAMSWLYLAT